MRLFALVGVVAFAGVSHGQIVSTFDSDAEGWTGSEDFGDFEWVTEGNPAGSITARDRGDGRIWKYRASSAYEGEKSAFFGGTLSWDILGVTGNQTSISPRADVLIVGGGITIGLAAGVQPLVGEWTSWSVTLDASEDWRLVSDFADAAVSGRPVATEAEIQSVLNDIEGLYIRGEYTNGADRTRLDNVELVPGPGVLGVFGLMGVAARRRRG